MLAYQTVLHFNLWICSGTYGNRNFVDVIKFRIFTWGDYPEFFEWVWCSHKGLVRVRQEVRKEWRYDVDGFEDTEMRPWAKEYKYSLEAEQGKATDYSPRPPERNFR